MKSRGWSNLTILFFVFIIMGGGVILNICWEGVQSVKWQNFFDFEVKRDYSV